MSDYGVSGIGASAWDGQTFGARTVSGVLDALNSGSASSLDSAPVDKQTFGAAVVAKTLDYMNSGSGGNERNSSYDFQTTVLEAWTSGAVLNNIA